jgi:hypothetical protein
MSFVLLTWNPGPDDDHVWSPDEWLAVMVAPHLAGRVVETTWGVGRHRNNIGLGDTAFLYRQGQHGRGIVARGVIQTSPESGVRPGRARGRITNFVHVSWQESVPIDLAIEVDELEALGPEFPWRQVYSSGRQLPPEVGRRLTAAWADHVSSADG